MHVAEEMRGEPTRPIDLAIPKPFAFLMQPSDRLVGDQKIDDVRLTPLIWIVPGHT